MPGIGEIFSQLTNGVILGLILALVATGFTMVLGVMGILNFSHGLLFALGAYLALTIYKVTGYWAALLLAPLLVGALGILLENVFIRRLYGKDPLFVLLLTFGIAMAGEDVIQMIWGKLAYSIDPPAQVQGVLNLGFMLYSKYRVFMGLFALLAIFSVWLFMARTPYGAIIRAGAYDSEMVGVLGKNLPRIRSLVFGLAAAMAALAGIIAAPLWSIRPQMGLDALLPAFLIVVIGGMGSFWGSVLGGLLVGISNSIAVMFIPRFADLMMYVLAVVILLYRPRGLMGTRSVLE
ncbi:branched-chain amino acid ABC transporter permease [Castellaniella sp.]|uniref:branched-chain amino acid ABC transporter permease n=1 Tax=Castellaniella sp. TaxID=1955812 RepID=UPI003C756E81